MYVVAHPLYYLPTARAHQASTTTANNNQRHSTAILRRGVR